MRCDVNDVKGAKGGEMMKEKVLLVLLFTVFFTTVPSAGDEVAIVSMPNVTISPDAQITIPITLRMTDYGAGTIEVRYNSSIVHVTSASSTQSSAITAYNVNNSSGIARISAWNLNGVSGNITFANLTFKSVGVPGTSELILNVLSLGNTHYENVKNTTINGSIRVLSPTPSPQQSTSPSSSSSSSSSSSASSATTAYSEADVSPSPTATTNNTATSLMQSVMTSSNYAVPQTSPTSSSSPPSSHESHNATSQPQTPNEKTPHPLHTVAAFTTIIVIITVMIARRMRK